PASGQLLLFGGDGVNGPVADTWSWDGSTWRQFSPATSPSARIGAGMDYDPTSGQLLLFGGITVAQTFSDTWGWSSGPNTPVHVDVTSGPPQVTGGTGATLAFAASGGSGA